MIPSVNDRECSLSQARDTESPLAGTDDDTELRAISIDQWHEFSRCHPDRMIFHHRCWIELLMEQYRLACRIPAVLRGGEIVAAAPFLKTRSLSGKRKYVSLPFTDYVHPLVARDDMRDELRSALIQDPVLCRSRAVLLRTDKPLTESLAPCRWIRHRLDIARPVAEIRKGFDRRVLQNLRRGEQGQLRYSTNTDAQSMETYYRLHLTTRRRLGVPVQPRSFFRRLQQRVVSQGVGFVGLVHHNETAIAAGVFLGDGDVLFAKYLASDHNALNLFPNEHLVFQTIQEAIARGHRVFDFGICPREQEGLRRFKLKWGTVESDIFHDNLLGGQERFGQDSGLLKLVKGVIRHSPPVVCQLVGELFYRFSY